MHDNTNITYGKIGSDILSNWVNIRGKLLHVLILFLLLNLMLIFPGNDVEAKIKDYGEALLEITEVTLPDDVKAKDYRVEGEEPYVELSTRDVESINLTLKDSIILTLQNNYDIRIAKIDPKIKEKEITVEKSEFDPKLKIEGKRDVGETPSVSGIAGGQGQTEVELFELRQDRNTFKAEVEKPIETGGTFKLDFNIAPRIFNEPAGFSAGLNPQSTASIEIGIKQPLLKGAGIFYNRSKIYIARNNKKISILKLKEKAIEVINSVQNAYWDLVMAIEELRVRNKSLESAEDLLRKNRIQVKVGTLAPIEVLVAEDGVAKKIDEIIDAENEIINKEDELKKIMNLSNHSILSDAAIIPLDKASFKITDVSIEESIKIALGNRPELFEKGLDIENARIEVRRKKNQLLPQLDIEAGISYHGLAGAGETITTLRSETEITEEIPRNITTDDVDENGKVTRPTTVKRGVLIGTFRTGSENYKDALDSLFSEQFQREFIGITLEIPLGNRKARSNYSKAKLEARQKILERSKQEQEIVVEVRKAVREIKKNAESITATEKARELAQKRLEAEEIKFKVGRSTSLEVLRAQDNYTIAEGKAVQALIDYQKSLGDLDAKMGTILENNNIIIED